MTVRLALFDIDGTLIRRGDPAHVGAMDVAFRAAYPQASAGVSMDQIDFDGKLDAQIMRALLNAAELDGSVPLSDLQPTFALAGQHYAAAWQGREGTHDLLPGVVPLLQRLSADERFRLGVLTGGMEAIVAVKLRRLGLDGFFPIGAFGDEVETRPDLLPLAIRRADVAYGLRFAPARVVIVGDTPHDVTCAHTGDSPCLGVATGRYSATELGSAGADQVLADLTDTDGVIAALLRLTS